VALAGFGGKATNDASSLVQRAQQAGMDLVVGYNDEPRAVGRVVLGSARGRARWISFAASCAGMAARLSLRSGVDPPAQRRLQGPPGPTG